MPAPATSLAPRSAQARGLAGRILERAAGHHGCDDLLADCAGTIAEFGEALDRYLRSRPADYLVSFRALLAVAQEYHWANALDGFTDDIYELECPHCGAGMKIAVGGFGCYSQVWDGNEELRRELRPAVAEELTGTGRWMHQTAVRDGQAVLADGIAHLFGEAECPVCASVFNVADEYTHANRPAVRFATAEVRLGVADAAQPRPDREPGSRDDEPRQDPGMPCDVCDHEMVRWTHRPNEAAEHWSCPWCYAVTSFDLPQFEMSRSAYMPPDLRWETASSELLWDASRHTSGGRCAASRSRTCPAPRTACGAGSGTTVRTAPPWQRPSTRGGPWTGAIPPIARAFVTPLRRRR
ncbi:hypothetical protein GCM10010430_73360 [Kitasatospora cystarginea]|uniref:Uncharacterized protein n=1 Tax=Kitasatospora cystarginea TaxID=58350 RepID=A0ABN3EYA8_9ACTN